MAQRVSSFTPDFDGKPFRVAYSYTAKCHVVVEVATSTVTAECDGPMAAYELAAAKNYDAANEAGESDDAVYCEACGAPVDSAVAVLDGEQMVCPGCAPCTVAQFEAMQQADALAALVPDPATWQAVSEILCEPAPIEPVTPIGETLARAPIFDALCQSVDELRDYWRDVPRRLKAIDDAWAWVLEQDYYCFNPQGDLLVPSSSTDGRIYAVGHTCPCDAGHWGGNCRHATIAHIIGRARRIARTRIAA